MQLYNGQRIAPSTHLKIIQHILRKILYNIKKFPNGRIKIYSPSMQTPIRPLAMCHVVLQSCSIDCTILHSSSCAAIPSTSVREGKTLRRYRDNPRGSGIEIEPMVKQHNGWGDSGGSFPSSMSRGTSMPISRLTTRVSSLGHSLARLSRHLRLARDLHICRRQSTSDIRPPRSRCSISGHHLATSSISASHRSGTMVVSNMNLCK